MLIEGLIDIGLAVILFFLIKLVVKNPNIMRREKIFFAFLNILVFVSTVALLGGISFARDEITLIATREVGSQSNSNELFRENGILTGTEFTGMTTQHIRS